MSVCSNLISLELLVCCQPHLISLSNSCDTKPIITHVQWRIPCVKWLEKATLTDKTGGSEWRGGSYSSRPSKSYSKPNYPLPTLCCLSAGWAVGSLSSLMRWIGPEIARNVLLFSSVSVMKLQIPSIVGLKQWKMFIFYCWEALTSGDGFIFWSERDERASETTLME